MNRTLKGAGIYLVMLLLIVFIVQYSGGQNEKVKDMDFSKVYQELQEGNISSLQIVDQTGIEGTLKDGKTKFKSYIPQEVMGNKLSDSILNSIEK